MLKLFSAIWIVFAAFPVLAQSPIQAYGSWEPLNYKGKLAIVADYDASRIGSITAETNGWVNEFRDRLMDATRTENLLLQSSSFNNWTLALINAFGATDTGAHNAGSFANTTRTLDPLGGNAADFVQLDNSSGIHAVSLQSLNGIPAGNLVYSFYAKAAPWDLISCRVQDSANAVFGWFDLTAVSVVTNTVSGQTKALGASIADVGNGWRLCKVFFRNGKTYTGISDQQAWIQFLTNSTPVSGSFAGDGTKGIYLFGAQIKNAELDKLGAPYQATTTTAVGGSKALYSYYNGSSNQIGYSTTLNGAGNMLMASDDLTNTVAWSRLAGGTGAAPTITPGQADPDGGNNAFLVVFNKGAGTTTSDWSLLSQSLSSWAVRTDLRFWTKTSDNSTVVMYSLRGSLANPMQFTNTGTWQYVTNVTAANDSGIANYIGLRGGQTPANANTASVLIYHPQVRETNWSTAYVSTGLGASPAALPGQGSIYLDGNWAFLQSSAFALVQPTTVVALFRPWSATTADSFYDGVAGTSTGRLDQQNAIGGWEINAGVNLADNASSNVFWNWTASAAVYSGANSWFSLNARTNATGNAGTASMNGFCLGAGPAGVGPANAQFSRATIVAGRTNTPAELNYLRWGGLKRTGIQ